MNKRFFIRILALSLSVLLMLTGCGDKKEGPAKDNKKEGADQQYLFGVCYVFDQMQNRVKNSEAISLITTLGAKSVRVWNHATSVTTDCDTINADAAKKYHDLYSAMSLAGIDQIIGMSHFWYSPESPDARTIQIPYRDMTEGSDYMKFLDMYYRLWKTLAKEFPEIKYWEMGNEFNHDPFLNPVGYTDGNDGIAPFTLEEKADISTDMFYYSSKAIKEANPDALRIMAPMAPSDGMDGIAMTDYLKRIYENIKSGNFGDGSKDTNDYFQALSWHPYSPFNCPDQAWVDANKAIYQIAADNGDGKKKVYFSEVGFPDGGDEATDEEQANWVKELYRLTKEQLPFVESIHYYRLFNDGANDKYGLMNEPKDGYGAKAKGLAYQEAAGGKGNLNKYVVDFDKYAVGDNLAFRMPVSASTSCEHPAWSWSKGFINDGDKLLTGWSNFYEVGEADWVNDPNGWGANTPDTKEWLQISFPKVANINKVILYSRTEINQANPDCQKIQGVPRAMYVEVSEDAISWTKVADYTVKEEDVIKYPDDVSVDKPMALDISFSAINAKHVRVTFTKLDPFWAGKEGCFFVQLREIEIIKAG